MNSFNSTKNNWFQKIASFSGASDLTAMRVTKTDLVVIKIKHWLLNDLIISPFYKKVNILISLF